MVSVTIGFSGPVVVVMEVLVLVVEASTCFSLEVDNRADVELTGTLVLGVSLTVGKSVEDDCGTSSVSILTNASSVLTNSSVEKVVVVTSLCVDDTVEIVVEVAPMVEVIVSLVVGSLGTKGCIVVNMSVSTTSSVEMVGC